MKRIIRFIFLIVGASAVFTISGAGTILFGQIFDTGSALIASAYVAATLAAFLGDISLSIRYPSAQGQVWRIGLFVRLLCGVVAVCVSALVLTCVGQIIFAAIHHPNPVLPTAPPFSSWQTWVYFTGSMVLFLPCAGIFGCIAIYG